MQIVLGCEGMTSEKATGANQEAVFLSIVFGPALYSCPGSLSDMLQTMER